MQLRVSKFATTHFSSLFFSFFDFLVSSSFRVFTVTLTHTDTYLVPFLVVRDELECMLRLSTIGYWKVCPTCLVGVWCSAVCLTISCARSRWRAAGRLTRKELG